MSAKRVKVQITYKTGHVQTVTCEYMNVSRNTMTGDITKVEWKDMEPKPLFLGMENIESIWQVD